MYKRVGGELISNLETIRSVKFQISRKNEFTYHYTCSQKRCKKMKDVQSSNNLNIVVLWESVQSLNPPKYRG